MVALLGGLCIMGGTYLSIGNSILNSCGEFNFQADVEAVASVLKVEII
jgi:inosine-uridine nucleoside N-ribohydrolase